MLITEEFSLNFLYTPSRFAWWGTKPTNEFMLVALVDNFNGPP
jgi:hypothetical protein